MPMPLPALLPLIGFQATAPEPLPYVPLPPELERVLRDYERAWQAKDAAALADLFAEDGFVLALNRAPVRGRAAIKAAYAGAGGPLGLRAYIYRTQGDLGIILGGYATTPGGPDVGKFTLTLQRVAGRWLIFSDMDNGNAPARRPPTPAPGP